MAPLVVSKSLSLQITSSGTVSARASISRPAVELGNVDLTVLRCFGKAIDPRVAWETLARTDAVSWEAFSGACDALVHDKLLVGLGVVGGAPTHSGFGSLGVHASMLADVERVATYQKATFAAARDKVVLDLGCGTGILSIFAAQAGAKRVHAIEETGVAELAAEMFRVNGVADRVVLHRANSRDVELPERVDLIVHEIFGTDPFAENVLPSLADALERFGTSTTVLLPGRLDVFCIGMEAERPSSRTARPPLDGRELTERYGVDFSPFIEAMRTKEAAGQTRVLHVQPRELWKEGGALTEPVLLRTLELGREATVRAGQRTLASMRATASGRMGRLWVYFTVDLGAGLLLSTSPLASTTNWGVMMCDLAQPIEVQPGQEILVSSQVVESAGAQYLKLGVM